MPVASFVTPTRVNSYSNNVTDDDQHQHAPRRCPKCRDHALETTALSISIRGYVFAFNISRRRHFGCAPCVQRALRDAAGRSFLLGWFSVFSLVLNPIFILTNLVRSAFLKTNRALASAELKKLCLDDPARTNALLAACVLRADGAVEDSERATVQSSAGELLFDTDFFNVQLEEHTLPDAGDVAYLAARNDGQKHELLLFLTKIAHSDESQGPEERLVLTWIRRQLN